MKNQENLGLKTMHVSLILYAEHEFNASTFTSRVIAGTNSDMYSCITGSIGALRGPKHGGANEVAFRIQERYSSADEAEKDIKERIAKKRLSLIWTPCLCYKRSKKCCYQKSCKRAI